MKGKECIDTECWSALSLPRPIYGNQREDQMAGGLGQAVNIKLQPDREVLGVSRPSARACIGPSVMHLGSNLLETNCFGYSFPCAHFFKTIFLTVLHLGMWFSWLFGMFCDHFSFNFHFGCVPPKSNTVKAGHDKVRYKEVPDIAKWIFVPCQNPSVCRKTIVGYSIVGYNVMLLIMLQFFWPQLIELFRYSKVAAYSKANMQWRVHFRYNAVVIFVCGPPGWQSFSAACISNTLQPLDSSANRGKQAFAQAHEIRMLPFCLWWKQISCA